MSRFCLYAAVAVWSVFVLYRLWADVISLWLRRNKLLRKEKT